MSSIYSDESLSASLAAAERTGDVVKARAWRALLTVPEGMRGDVWAKAAHAASPKDLVRGRWTHSVADPDPVVFADTVEALAAAIVAVPVGERDPFGRHTYGPCRCGRAGVIGELLVEGPVCHWCYQDACAAAAASTSERRSTIRPSSGTGCTSGSTHAATSIPRRRQQPAGTGA